MDKTTYRFMGFCGVLALGAAVALTGCSDDASGDDADAGINTGELPTQSVAGTAIDFKTRTPIDGNVTLQLEGVLGASDTTAGADFTVERIPPSSIFYLLTGSSPDYRDTYNNAIEVLTDDLSGVEALVVSEAYAGELTGGFGVTPASGTTILLVKVLGEDGTVRAGVPASAFEVNGAAPAAGPYFLDANLDPAPQLNETSASGYVVFFDVTPGPLAVTAATGSNVTMDMPVAPSAATTVTLAEAKVIDGEVPLPTNVSFSTDILPIWSARNCTGCHAGGGIGREDGGLALQGGANKMYKEVVEELSPNYQKARVDRNSPMDSLILTMPGPAPDRHPNTTFANQQDGDYLKILVWIQEGALDN